MKKFDLEKAKAGSPIVTRDGRPARLLGERQHPNYPIIAVVEKKGIEEVYSYNTYGYNITMDETENDLFMARTKRKMYANLYFHLEKYKLGELFNSEKEAIGSIIKDRFNNYINTIEIEWEE